MPEFSATQLAEWAEATWLHRMPERIEGFCHDSRRLKPGEMFVALAGGSRDGHSFLEDARARGAAAVLVDRPVPESPLPQLVARDVLGALHRMASKNRDRFSGPVIGVTGSCGKTSAKDLLAELLAFRGPVLRTTGNFNNHIGVPLTLLSLDPDYHRAAVVEAGINAPGEMSVLAGLIRPTHGMVTNVAPTHLEGLKNLAAVAAEKSLLLHALQPGGVAAFPETCLAFPGFWRLRCRSLVTEDESAVPPAAQRFLTGLMPEFSAELFVTADRRAVFAREGEGRNGSLRVCFPGEARSVSFAAGTLSPGMAANAVLAMMLARTLGADDDALAAGLSHWRPDALRGRAFRTEAGFYYLDCYNSSPMALVDALEAFNRAAPAGMPRLYILGSMAELGPYANVFHRETMRFLKLEENDFACLIGDHAAAMGEGLAAAGNDSSHWTVEQDWEPVRARYAAFHGAVFVKGSRRYRLERLLEETPAEKAYPAGKEVAC